MTTKTILTQAQIENGNLVKERFLESFQFPWRSTFNLLASFSWVVFVYFFSYHPETKMNTTRVMDMKYMFLRLLSSLIDLT